MNTALDSFGISNHSMKTRIIHTKFWTDPYILNLPTKARCLFNFYITNDRIGLTGVYEMPRVLTQVSTGLSFEEIEEFNRRFMADKKIVFYDEWVCIVNVSKYQMYTGEKNEKAIVREWKLLPNVVRKMFSQYTMHTLSDTENTLRNHKSEIIEQKPESGMEIDVDEVAEAIEAQKRAPRKN